MTDLHTDGNHVAAALWEFLAVEPTTTRRRCPSCGDEHVLAKHRAYHGAGVALRCPGCGDVAVRIAGAGPDLRIELRGVYRFTRTG
jgi:predicted RNA-binding Zn-ribbon protein involved in translation (DUF1610 family)